MHVSTKTVIEIVRASRFVLNHGQTRLPDPTGIKGFGGTRAYPWHHNAARDIFNPSPVIDPVLVTLDQSVLPIKLSVSPWTPLVYTTVCLCTGTRI